MSVYCNSKINPWKNVPRDTVTWNAKNSQIIQKKAGRETVEWKTENSNKMIDVHLKHVNIYIQCKWPGYKWNDRQIVRMDNKTRVNMCCLQEAHFKHDIGG